MIQLEDRLTGHFQLEAGALAEHISPVGDLGAVKARARQRTRNRGLATAAAGLRQSAAAASTIAPWHSVTNAGVVSTTAVTKSVKKTSSDHPAG